MLMKSRRMTRQRQVILEELRQLDSHPTVADLYEVVRGRLPKISLGTVYRNLELLVKSGDIRKLETGGGEARFDPDLHHHYHIRCVQCGRLDDYVHPPEIRVDGAVAEQNGWEILEHKVEFLGTCPGCRALPPTDKELVN